MKLIGIFMILTFYSFSFFENNKMLTIGINFENNKDVASWAKFDTTIKKDKNQILLEIIPNFALKVTKGENNDLKISWDSEHSDTKNIIFGIPILFHLKKDFYESELVKEDGNLFRIILYSKKYAVTIYEKFVKSLVELNETSFRGIRGYNLQNIKDREKFIEKYSDITLSSFFMLKNYNKNFSSVTERNIIELLINNRLRKNSSPFRFDDVSNININFNKNEFIGSFDLNFGDVDVQNLKHKLIIKCDVSGKYENNTLILEKYKILVNNTIIGCITSKKKLDEQIK